MGWLAGRGKLFAEPRLGAVLPAGAPHGAVAAHRVPAARAHRARHPPPGRPAGLQPHPLPLLAGLQARHQARTTPHWPNKATLDICNKRLRQVLLLCPSCGPLCTYRVVATWKSLYKIPIYLLTENSSITAISHGARGERNF